MCRALQKVDNLVELNFQCSNIKLKTLHLTALKMYSDLINKVVAKVKYMLIILKIVYCYKTRKKFFVPGTFPSKHLPPLKLYLLMNVRGCCWQASVVKP